MEAYDTNVSTRSIPFSIPLLVLSFPPSVGPCARSPTVFFLFGGMSGYSPRPHRQGIRPLAPVENVAV